MFQILDVCGQWLNSVWCLACSHDACGLNCGHPNMGSHRSNFRGNMRGNYAPMNSRDSFHGDLQLKLERHVRVLAVNLHEMNHDYSE